MNAAKQAAWLFCALIALACSGYYFASNSTLIKLDKNALSITADAVITNLSVRQFDKEGKLAHHLNTPEMRHIPKNDTHILKSPQIIITQADQPPMEIRSTMAKALHGGEQITFRNNVIVHQGQNKNTEESTLRTDELLYYPKQKLATSTKVVTFEKPGSIVHSKGMKAYLEDKHIQLLSRAHATIEPKKNV